MAILPILLEQSINELGGLNLDHLVQENRTYVENWATDQGPESGTLAVQI
jgi:hypothetical protein